jgi:hypothetical protein
MAGAAVDAISAGRLGRGWSRPHPLDWLRAASLERRLAPYSAFRSDLPLDTKRR